MQNLTDKNEPITAEAVEQILKEITTHAASWLGLSGQAIVTLHQVYDRPQSTLILVGVGGSHKELLIKSPKVTSYDPRFHDRLLKPVSSPLVKSKLEFEALSAIAQHFEALADPRFAWIKVYAHLENPPATVIEKVSEVTFDKLLRQPKMAQDGYTSSRVMKNLGSWLAEYHKIDMRQVELRDARADQVITGMVKLLGIISNSNSWPRPLPESERVIRQAASYLLPDELPLGLGHGDFAPRNVFVGSGSSVAVIDSLARYSAPIYEDIAYLLVELLSGAVRLRRGTLPISTAELAGLRTALLEGYSIADDEVLNIFELRALLDKWRSLTQRARSNNLKGRATRMVDTFRRIIVSQRANTLIKQLRKHQ